MSKHDRGKLGSRKEVKHILILCAETEYAYLDDFCKRENIRNQFFKVKLDSKNVNHTPNKSSYEKHLRKIEKSHRVEYAKIYHVFDLERPTANNQTNGMLDYIKECNQSKNIIEPITQMPSIEAWFLLHFTNSFPTFSDATQCEAHLKSIWQSYDKNNSDFSEIAGKHDDAIKNYKTMPVGSLSGNFASLRITNPMVSIRDLMIKLKKHQV